MNNWGSTVKRIEQLLAERGPMTRVELEDALHLDHRRIASIVSRMCRPTKTIPKRIYIKSWVYDHEKQRYYPRAVYALGDKRNATKPKPNPLEARRKYDRKIKMMMTSNSIFNMGLTRKQYLAKRREANA